MDMTRVSGVRLLFLGGLAFCLTLLWGCNVLPDPIPAFDGGFQSKGDVAAAPGPEDGKGSGGSGGAGGTGTGGAGGTGTGYGDGGPTGGRDAEGGCVDDLCLNAGDGAIGDAVTEGSLGDVGDIDAGLQDAETQDSEIHAEGL
jgi:hypothetical protein